MPRLLVVHHSPTPTVQRLTDAVLAGTRDDAIDGVEVVVRAALEAHADDVLAADGFLLGTTANFGYMSGALKHFFDTIFLEAGGALGDDGSAADAGAAGRAEALRPLRARPLRHHRRRAIGADHRGGAPLASGRAGCSRSSATRTTTSSPRPTSSAARWPHC